MQFDAEVLRADLKDLGAHAVVDAEAVAQDVDQALLAGEAHQHAGHATDLHLAAQFFLFDLLFAGQFAVGDGIQAGAVLVEGSEGLLGFPPLPHQEFVGHDAVQPGAEAAFSLERGQFGDDLQENLLGQIQRVVRVVDHLPGHVVDKGLVEAHEAVQRLPVPLYGGGDEAAIIFFGVLLGQGVKHGGFYRWMRQKVRCYGMGVFFSGRGRGRRHN